MSAERFFDTQTVIAGLLVLALVSGFFPAIRNWIFSQRCLEPRARLKSRGLKRRFHGHLLGGAFTLFILLVGSPLFGSHAYDQQLKRRVDAVWYKPDGSEGLSTTVRFGLDLAGKLTELRIVRSSGNAAFDKSLLEAFRRAAPFSPPPQAIAGTYSTVEFTFGSPKAAQSDDTAKPLGPEPQPPKPLPVKPSPRVTPKKDPQRKNPSDHI